MGPDVLVSNLWEIRDFWGWLFPGYGSGNNKDATQRGAIVYYENISHYRDFELRKEVAKNPGDNSVGMCAKRFMSDPDSAYEYIGTVTTWNLYKSVVGGKRPALAKTTDKKARISHNADVLHNLQKALTGMFKDHFRGRLGDAIALCQHNWHHFKDSPGEIPERRRLTPIELFLHMKNANVRRGTPETSGTSVTAFPAAAARDGWLEATLSTRPPPMRQRTHMLAEVNGVPRSARSPLVVSEAPSDQ